MDVERITEAGVKAGAALAGFVKAMGKDKTRSRLAEALGVEDGQYFTFRGSEYQLLNECIQWHDKAGGVWHVADSINICHMINHPEEITPCPVWSEESIKAARVFEQAGFSEVTRHKRPRAYLLLEVPDDDAVATATDISPDMFPEVLPGQTVKLSEIK